jgi:hypothetical protein
MQRWPRGQRVSKLIRVLQVISQLRFDVTCCAV